MSVKYWELFGTIVNMSLLFFMNEFEIKVFKIRVLSHPPLFNRK